jgi:hypothetical protein
LGFLRSPHQSIDLGQTVKEMLDNPMRPGSGPGGGRRQAAGRGRRKAAGSGPASGGQQEAVADQVPHFGEEPAAECLAIELSPVAQMSGVHLPTA